MEGNPVGGVFSSTINKSLSLIDQLNSINDSHVESTRSTFPDLFVFNGEPVKGSFGSEKDREAFLFQSGVSSHVVRPHSTNPKIVIFRNLESFFNTKYAWNQGKNVRDSRLLLDGFYEPNTTQWRSPTIPNDHKLLIKVTFNTPINSKSSLLSHRSSLLSTLNAKIADLAENYDEVDGMLARDSTTLAYFYLNIPNKDRLFSIHTASLSLFSSNTAWSNPTLPILNHESQIIGSITNVSAPSLSQLSSPPRTIAPKNATRITIPFSLPPSLDSTRLLNKNLQSLFPVAPSSDLNSSPSALHDDSYTASCFQACLPSSTPAPRVQLYLGHHYLSPPSGSSPLFLTLLAHQSEIADAFLAVKSLSDPLPQFQLTESDTSPICLICGSASHLHNECHRKKIPTQSASSSSNLPPSSLTPASGLCFKFQTGSCRRGVSCRFSHSISTTSASPQPFSASLSPQSSSASASAPSVPIRITTPPVHPPSSFSQPSPYSPLISSSQSSPASSSANPPLSPEPSSSSQPPTKRQKPDPSQFSSSGGDNDTNMSDQPPGPPATTNSPPPDPPNHNE